MAAYEITIGGMMDIEKRVNNIDASWVKDLLTEKYD